MNAAQLVCLAGAHGVDLQYVAATAIETKGIARQRPRTEVERKLGIEVRETARGRQTRGIRRADWTVAELAQAAAAGGVHGVLWLAARFSIGGDPSCLHELHGALTYQAHHIARRESWAPQVMSLDGRPRFFRERLAELVLTVEQHRHYFAAAPALYAACLDVSADVWERNMRDPFQSLSQKYSSWVDIACAGIRRGIRGE